LLRLRQSGQPFGDHQMKAVHEGLSGDLSPRRQVSATPAAEPSPRLRASLTALRPSPPPADARSVRSERGAWRAVPSQVPPTSIAKAVGACWIRCADEPTGPAPPSACRPRQSWC
jgi:hypothetical protein